jgi:hypothetical protein
MNQSPRDIFDLYSLENDNSDFGVYKTEKKSNLFENDKQGMPDGDIFDQLSSKKEDRSFGIGETLKDVGQQIASKGAQGFLGAYGNIAELLGQGKENLTPGMEARFSREFEDPLQSEVEDYPSYARLPTGEDIGALIKGTTGVGEGKTPAGRIAGRGAEFLGGGAAIPLGMGGKAAATLAGAGVAGQSLREAGAPEALATGTEIAGTILPGAIKGKVAPTGKEGKALAEGGRALGLTERELSPLLKSQKEIATLSKIARKGGKTKELFESIKTKLGDSYDNLKKSPGAQSNIAPKQSSNLIRKFVDIETDLGKTLQPSPDKEAALKFIRGSIDKLVKDGATPEELINFWQDINKSVKWNSIQGGKKALARLKDPILDTLKEVDPNMAKNFEMTNQLYTKYAQVAKKLKPDLVDSFVSKAELSAVAPAALGLAMGNPWVFAGLAGEASMRTLAREMIINPYFQNLSNKLVKNLNSGSVKGIQEALSETKSFMEKKHPNEDWKFLTEEHSL